MAARDVLGKCRELFASTHWMQGAYSRYDEELDKMRYCAVGGLREVAQLDPNDDGGDRLEDDDYKRACLLLVEAIDPGRIDDYKDEYGTDITADLFGADLHRTEEAVGHLEQRIIDWNDGSIELSVVLRAFDEALAASLES